MLEEYRRTVQRWHKPDDAHFFTFSCFHKKPFLRSERACKTLARAIPRACRKYHAHLWAYVFMPDHAHLLVWSPSEDFDPSHYLKSLKQTVSQTIIAYVRKTKPSRMEVFATGQKKTPYRFWQAGGGCDANIVEMARIRNTIKYIHENPVRAELVELPEDWYWSSVNAYMGKRPPFPVDIACFNEVTNSSIPLADENDA